MTRVWNFLRNRNRLEIEDKKRKLYERMIAHDELAARDSEVELYDESYNEVTQKVEQAERFVNVPKSYTRVVGKTKPA